MNIHLKENKELVFSTAPVMIAAWPGAGSVGLMALDYLRFKLDAEPFSQPDISSLLSPSSIPVKGGKFVRPTLPNCAFYFKSEPALILFKCDALFAEKESLSLLRIMSWNGRRNGE